MSVIRPAFNRLQYYYKILGLTEDAVAKDIKTAFRQQAKAFHPDINKEAGAHERFIDINEAYTFLMKFHAGGQGIAGPVQCKEYKGQWTEEERQRARARAAGRAKMKFEEFRRSPVYRTTSMMSHILDYFLFLLGISIITGAVSGLLSQGILIDENGEDVINFRGIVAVIVITIVGFFIIFMSYGNIKAFRKEVNEKTD